MLAWAALEPMLRDSEITKLFNLFVYTVNHENRSSNKNKFPKYKNGVVFEDSVKVEFEDETFYIMDTGHMLYFTDNENKINTMLKNNKKNEQLLFPIFKDAFKYKILDLGEGLESYYKSSIFNKQDN